MYIPNIFLNSNQSEIEQFIHDNGFAILVNQTNQKLWATHIPLILKRDAFGNKKLFGHLSKENPQADSFNTNDQVMVIFSGPHSYISSSWYDHENVPTWNYIAVHVYGKVKIQNFEETLDSLKDLVDKYEINSENPVKVEDLTSKTMMQARGIVGLEISISNIEAKKKLSQNRDDKNYMNIILELEKTNKTNEVAVSNEMKKCPR